MTKIKELVQAMTTTDQAIRNLKRGQEQAKDMKAKSIYYDCLLLLEAQKLEAEKAYYQELAKNPLRQAIQGELQPNETLTESQMNQVLMGTQWAIQELIQDVK